MGKQVNFILHPDDYADFEALLRTCGPMLVLPHHHYDGKVAILSDTLFKKTDEWDTVYLIRQADLEQVQLEYSEKTKCWFLSRTAPLMEYRRCRYNSNEDWGSGRLYFSKDYFNTEGDHFKHSDGFIEWAESILASVKKKLKKYTLKGASDWETVSTLVAPNAKAWLDKRYR